ncbi:MULTISPECIES: bifunctional DNA primase/polymerase [Streptomyces]|uniref:bifunctional DNA primase/polymerase n=1 Tax=Streptomyces TaxID=1883 RepID=UPI00163B92C2|nr:MULTISPECIES: bifunctional DNA primase/polymerase [Streptomyces]MBC2873941.1 bifunctional DNA primase/polymerase [Streptomyces sp. TYQ1024]UBI39115.1 bifunctional DNA primase/polymerase [Streptomyces mobaraensis]UKW31695.1 bifunctional DNA primase/polymerase [Streptomyces sp. TYQ1024]
MERKSRFSQWLRRPRSGAGGDTGAGAATGAAREELLLAAAAAGFPLAPAAHPSGYGCSCERIGCPTPGRHPVSFAWQTLATTDPEKVTKWLRAQPEANFVTATGMAHDVLDVPAEAGRKALDRLTAAGVEVGPVATVAPDRMLFFTATRGTPDDEDEWWPCELDCHPETLDEHPGLRWHCRGSYVLLPPSRLPGDDAYVAWLVGPERPLPDPLTLLETLTDACAQYAGDRPDHEHHAAWPIGR